MFDCSIFNSRLSLKRKSVHLNINVIWSTLRNTSWSIADSASFQFSPPNWIHYFYVYCCRPGLHIANVSFSSRSYFASFSASLRWTPLSSRVLVSCIAEVTVARRLRHQQVTTSSLDVGDKSVFKRHLLDWGGSAHLPFVQPVRHCAVNSKKHLLCQ